MNYHPFVLLALGVIWNVQFVSGKLYMALCTTDFEELYLLFLLIFFVFLYILLLFIQPFHHVSQTPVAMELNA